MLDNLVNIIKLVTDDYYKNVVLLRFGGGQHITHLRINNKFNLLNIDLLNPRLSFA